MKTQKIVLTSLMLSAVSMTAWSGGILTNTNQSIAFNRSMARDGVVAIDGVYSNPAGVAFMPEGLHLSFNIQSAYQTRTINSGITISGLPAPFNTPFVMNGGDSNGIKKFKGEASAPIVPSIQAALVKDRWSFQGSFAVVGGGGKCTFNHGLGSFERTVSLLPDVLAQTQQDYMDNYGVDLGLGTETPGYSVSSYMKGKQFVYGLQLGATYKITDHLAAYGGLRFNYIFNKYEGNIRDICANVNGKNENLYNLLGIKANNLSEQAANYTTQATAYKAQADALRPYAETDEKIKQQLDQLDAAVVALQKGAALAHSGAESMTNVQGQLKDRYLDCTQTGWSICPIIGIDYNYGPLNIGARLEFTTHFNIQNNTKVDDTGMFADGVNTPGDMPGLLTLGAQYSVIPSLRLLGGFHYFFDKDARMDNDKQTLLSHNTWEYNGGVEYDLTKDIMLSAGFQKTNYGLGDGSFLSDMSFVTSSYSIGFGGCVKLADNLKLNIAYFWTGYDTKHKEYEETYSAAGQSITAKCTDDFTRTNKVFGVGLDIDF